MLIPPARAGNAGAGGSSRVLPDPCRSVAPDPSRHVGVDVGGDGILPMLSDMEDDAALLGSVDRDDVETVRGHSNDGMERGSLAVPDVPAVAPRSSISARIGDNYAGKLEAGRAVPCESSVHALLPSDFATPAFQAVLRHIVNAGGAGLAQGDQEKLGALLLMLEESYKLSQDQRQVARRIPKAQSLVTSVRPEQRRVIGARHWMEIDIDIAGVTYPSYLRELLRTALDSLRAADMIVLVSEALDHDVEGVAHRSHTFDSNLFLNEQEDVRRLHGDAVRVLGVQLHVDEAVVSWNGDN